MESEKDKLTESSDIAVHDYLERMIPLQETNFENATLLNEIKREARSDGLNVDAINALLPILVKYRHDKGAAVINEIVRYAELHGADSIVSRGAVPTPEAAANASGTPSVSASANAAREAEAEVRPKPPAAPRDRKVALTRLRLSAQVVTATCVTAGLLWLLH